MIRYKQFGTDLLLLELVNATTPTLSIVKAGGATKKVPPSIAPTTPTKNSSSGDKTVAQWLSSMSKEQQALFSSLEGYVFSLGDEVQRKDLKLYVAFKRIKNFVCVGFKKDALFVWLKLDPALIEFEPGFSRNVQEIGHWGTGDVEVLIKNHADLDKAKSLIQKAYEG